MQPSKMYYQNNPLSVKQECLVYSFHLTHDLEGSAEEIFATAWLCSEEQWITAPLYCFTPVLTKVLNE